MKKLFFLLAIVLLAGYSKKNYSFQFDRLKAKCDNSKESKAVPAEKCASWYPAKASTKTVVKTVKGRPDTIRKEGKTIYVDCPDKTVKAVKCPPATTIYETDTLIIHDTTVTVDMAAVTAGDIEKNDLRVKTGLLQFESDKYKAKAKSRLFWCWINGVVAILLLAVLIGIFTGRLR